MTITDELKKVQEAMELIDEAADLLHYHGAFQYEGGKPQPFNREAEVAAELKALLSPIIAQVKALEAEAGVDEEALKNHLGFIMWSTATMRGWDAVPGAVFQAIRPYLYPTPDLDSPELREVVARALYEKEWESAKRSIPWNKTDEHDREYWLESADDAISAIKAHLEGKERA